MLTVTDIQFDITSITGDEALAVCHSIAYSLCHTEKRKLKLSKDIHDAHKTALSKVLIACDTKLALFIQVILVEKFNIIVQMNDDNIVEVIVGK